MKAKKHHNKAARKPLLLAVAALCNLLAFAQLNESDTARMQLRAGFTTAWQTGNVQLFVPRGNLEFVSNSRNALVFKSQNNSLYQSFGGYKADNDVRSQNYVYWQPTRRLYPFAMVYAQTNFRRQINNRLFGGLGGTVQVLMQPKNVLKLSASLVFENTVFNTSTFNEPAYNGSKNIALWRPTLYLAGWHKLSGDHILLSYSAYWQPAFSAQPNNRVHLSAGAEVPVYRGLRLQVRYGYDFEQVVATNVLQRDALLTAGIAYQLEK